MSASCPACDMYEARDVVTAARPKRQGVSHRARPTAAPPQPTDKRMERSDELREVRDSDALRNNSTHTASQHGQRSHLEEHITANVETPCTQQEATKKTHLQVGAFITNSCSYSSTNTHHSKSITRARSFLQEDK